MYFNDLDQRQPKDIAPGVRIRTFWGEEMLMSIVELDPDAVVPRHSHAHEQCGTVISGQMHLTIADETRTLKVGDTYLIPGGVEHSASAGRQAAVVLDVFSPVREEYQY